MTISMKEKLAVAAIALQASALVAILIALACKV